MPQNVLAAPIIDDSSGGQIITDPTSGSQIQANEAAAKQQIKTACDVIGGTVNQTTGYCEKDGRVLGSNELYGPKISVIDSLVGIFQNLIISAAFLIFVWGILTYTTSAGGKGVEKAKEYILSAVIALAALVLVRVFFKNTIGETPLPTATGSLDEILNIIRGGAGTTGPLEIFNVLSRLLTGITNWLLIGFPATALIFIMYSGLLYIFSAGNPKKTEAAVKSLNTSILGFVFFLMLYALWYFIRSFLGA
ncbi:MAG: hypothetical protein PHU42_00785 [Patescibacteria group bacterium]|nr:hypothetical protein [Patescibacteria group bacterium]